MSTRSTKNKLKMNFFDPKNFSFFALSLLSLCLSLLMIAIGLENIKDNQTSLFLQATSPQYSCTTISAIPAEECQALMQFYTYASGNNWTFTESEFPWFSTDNPCNWTGISCSSHQRIEAITLDSRNLVGSLPAGVWDSLTQLKKIDLRDNDRLGGAVPASIEPLQLQELYTGGSNLCLSASLEEWYLAIEITDEIYQCQSNTQSLKECNEICTAHSQCANDLFCFVVGDSQRCRLADNPQSTQCEELPDDGLNFECNHYCSNTGECADNLTCWYNRCRYPNNVESLTCSPPPAELQDRMMANCNQSCDSNRDCEINMRCYQGACRLAINPSNSQCQPITKIDAVARPSVAPPKGGTLQPSPTFKSPSPTTFPTTLPSPTQASRSATISPAAEVMTVTPTPTLESTAVIDDQPPTSSALSALLEFGKTRWQALIAFFQNSVSKLNLEQNSPRTKVGFGLIVLGLGLMIFSRALPKDSSPPEKEDSLKPPPSSMVNRVKQKNLFSQINSNQTESN